ncbi:TPR-like protein [Alternaria alternata]|nr:TPR-like protein [Alternaria alternata]
MASTFHGAIDAHVAIPAPHCGPGGTMNFNFGPGQADGQKQKPTPFSTVPFAPDPDLVDRPAVAAWVRDKCAGPGARAALVGLGGVGKSQIALQYAHSIRDAAPQTFVFWVHASTRARFEEAYKDIANRLELPGRDDPKANVLRLVHDWLRDEANGRWMMVVDNVDDVETFFPSRKRQRRGDEADASAQIPLATYLPQSRNGAILVTSRSQDAATRLVGSYNRTKEVLAMDEEEGLQLLRNKLQDQPVEESATDLLRSLDCIPLAVVQAAAYINRRRRMTIAGYLAEFRKDSKKRERLLKWDAGELRRDESASNSVVTTWQMSFEQIQRERRSAAELLSLMSFFNPQGIPESVLRRHSRAIARETELGDDEDADSAFDEDLDTLQAYSLVSMTADSEAFEMHALVQFCTRVWLSSCSDAEQWEQRFVVLMAQELHDGAHKNLIKGQQLLPHVEPLFITQPASEKAFEAWVEVLNNAACFLWKSGSYSVAQHVAEKAVAASEEALGQEDPLTLNGLNTLAVVLRAQGKYEEAETLHRRVLEWDEKNLGDDHFKTLTSMNNLALVLQDQNNYRKAEALHQRALEGNKKMLGEDHPYTLAHMNNLALVFKHQGRCEEAEPLYQRTLEGFEKVLGEDHPDTLISMSNLASVLHGRGRYEEAETLNRRALQGREKLGEDHPDTLTSVGNLASVLHERGRYEEAEMLSRRALEGSEKKLGQDHPDTLKCIHNLAVLLDDLRRYPEAAELYQRVCDRCTQQLGSQHPETILSCNNFAAMQQRAMEARLAQGEGLPPGSSEHIVTTVTREKGV